MQQLQVRVAGRLSVGLFWQANPPPAGHNIKNKLCAQTKPVVPQASWMGHVCGTPLTGVRHVRGAAVPAVPAPVSSCGKLYMRHKRSIDTSKHVCSRCSGRLLYLGKFRWGRIVRKGAGASAGTQTAVLRTIIGALFCK